MIVHSRMACPEKVNGKWIVVTKEFDEEIPDLGRHRLMCNRCGNKRYPECIPECPLEQGTIKREQEQAKKKAAQRKAEFDILAGLVKDGLLKVEDAAPRIEMTAEEFTAAMND